MLLSERRNRTRHIADFRYGSKPSHTNYIGRPFGTRSPRRSGPTDESVGYVRTIPTGLTSPRREPLTAKLRTIPTGLTSLRREPLTAQTPDDLDGIDVSAPRTSNGQTPDDLDGIDVSAPRISNGQTPGRAFSARAVGVVYQGQCAARRPGYFYSRPFRPIARQRLIRRSRSFRCKLPLRSQRSFGR